MNGISANILAIIESYKIPNADDMARKMADDFRKRRVEKGLTREAVAEAAGVPLSNVARFEQKGLVSLKNLAQLAIALGYKGELENVFSEPKFTTMAELNQIKKNRNKTRAYPARKEDSARKEKK